MSTYFGNKCYGCQHFDGFNRWDGPKTMVRCAIGVNAIVSQGCSSFTPDESANCWRDCYYHHGSFSEGHGCSKNHYSISHTNHTINNCYDYAHKEEDETRSSSKSGCFVTTAICDVLGKDDKCFELETLRKFRDEELLPDSELKKLVFEYYEISPRLVNKIMNHEDKHQFSQNLLNEHINIIIETINKGDKDLAIELYQNMLLAIEDAK